MSTKSKAYKLGPHATLFVYAPLDIKILEGQSVKIGPEALKHTYVRDAIASQHIVPADADDKSLKEVNEVEENTFNLAKATKAELVAEILEHEDNDLDEDELKAKNKAELVNIYENLTEVEEDEDEEEEEDEE